MHILMPITATKLGETDKDYFALLNVEALKLGLDTKLHAAITDNDALYREANRLGFRHFNQLAPVRLHCIEMVRYRVQHKEVVAKEWKDGYYLITDGEYEKHFA
jgi:hypothetical protein